MDDSDLKEMIDRARCKDTEAIGKLYEQYHDEGLHLARVFIKNLNEAEDMYRAAFSEAMSSIEIFDDTNDFGPWFKAIIVSTCKDHLVKRSEMIKITSGRKCD